MNVGELKQELEKYNDHVNIYVGNDAFEIIEVDIDGDDRGERIILFFKGEAKQDWYFSFGCGHKYHSKRYVKIHGTFSSARAEMTKCFGSKWAFQYPNLNGEKSPNADKWGLNELKPMSE